MKHVNRKTKAQFPLIFRLVGKELQAVFRAKSKAIGKSRSLISGPLARTRAEIQKSLLRAAKSLRTPPLL